MESRPRNHLLWIGPLLTFAGGVSYFLYFARFPALRDVPWVNLPLVLAGLLLSVIALGRAFSRRAVYRGKVLGSLALAFSVLLTGLFALYVFVWSYGLPEPGEVTLSLGEAPDFTLTDQHGEPVTLSALRGRKVVLTFYRGHW
jgi:hypothetical protein